MYKLVALLIVPFSGFYITKLPLSPIYIFFILSSFLVSLLFLYRATIIRSNIISIALIFLLYIIITHTLRGDSLSSSAIVNVVLSLLFFIFTYNVINKVPTIHILKAGNKLVYFSLPLLIYEAHYRISNPIFYFDPTEVGKEDMLFYVYKMNSIMYMDSNFVGIFIVAIFFFKFYLMSSLMHKRTDYLILLALIILCLLTLSRASILSIIIFSTIYPVRSLLYKKRKTVFILSVFVSIFLYGALSKFQFLDESFSTKFEIIEHAIKFVEHQPVSTVLFGAGLGNAVSAIGMGAHNFIVTYLIETGIIGLLVLSFLWGTILIKSKFKCGIVMFPFLLNGLSVAGHAIPYLYVIYAVILVVERRKQVAKSISFCNNTSI